MADTSAVAVLSGLVAGALSGTFVQWFRFAADDRSKRMDDLVDDILHTADLATEYWNTDAADDDIAPMEDRLQGAQHRISLLLHDVLPRVSERSPEIDGALASFFEAMTGGNFKTTGRERDRARASATQVSAANLIFEARKARRKYHPYPRSLIWHTRTTIDWALRQLRSWVHER